MRCWHAILLVCICTENSLQLSASACHYLVGHINFYGGISMSHGTWLWTEVTWLNASFTGLLLHKKIISISEKLVIRCQYQKIYPFDGTPFKGKVTHAAFLTIPCIV